MNILARKSLQIALISLFAAPLAALAADAPGTDHDSHHPAQAQSATAPEKATPQMGNQLQEKMHARMLAMRNTSDPEARQAMMMAQMDDMSAMMANMGSGCPMMAQDMMGGGKGGMMGKGGVMGNAAK